MRWLKVVTFCLLTLNAFSAPPVPPESKPKTEYFRSVWNDFLEERPAIPTRLSFSYVKWNDDNEILETITWERRNLRFFTRSTLIASLHEGSRSSSVKRMIAAKLPSTRKRHFLQYQQNLRNAVNSDKVTAALEQTAKHPSLNDVIDRLEIEFAVTEDKYHQTKGEYLPFQFHRMELLLKLPDKENRLNPAKILARIRLIGNHAKEQKVDLGKNTLPKSYRLNNMAQAISDALETLIKEEK